MILSKGLFRTFLSAGGKVVGQQAIGLTYVIDIGGGRRQLIEKVNNVSERFREPPTSTLWDPPVLA